MKKIQLNGEPYFYKNASRSMHINENYPGSLTLGDHAPLLYGTVTISYDNRGLPPSTLGFYRYSDELDQKFLFLVHLESDIVDTIKIDLCFFDSIRLDDNFNSDKVSVYFSGNELQHNLKSKSLFKELYPNDDPFKPSGNGGGGVTSYNDLTDKPELNYIPLPFIQSCSALFIARGSRVFCTIKSLYLEPDSYVAIGDLLIEEIEVHGLEMTFYVNGSAVDSSNPIEVYNSHGFTTFGTELMVSENTVIIPGAQDWTFVQGEAKTLVGNGSVNPSALEVTPRIMYSDPFPVFQDFDLTYRNDLDTNLGGNLDNYHSMGITTTADMNFIQRQSLSMVNTSFIDIWYIYGNDSHASLGSSSSKWVRISRRSGVITVNLSQDKVSWSTKYTFPKIVNDAIRVYSLLPNHHGIQDIEFTKLI